ncbi:MAG: tetratricopeptide repeat protein [Candidatus Gastranaerophilales bacterium]|nr:tetratricopeptide repeat protein [Candidatus Gastranaerophilales bacterium]
MYNSIYPININYTKHNKYRTQKGDINSEQQNQQTPVDDNTPKQQNTFPNGTKVAIDYTKGQINISQVLTDFRSTILAINAPKDVQDEVKVYLDLVERESKKETPSRDIITANLKIASKISDSFIARTLNKPSNVVEGWIDALFLQKINLKADPKEINPDFLLEFPQKAQERINEQKATVIEAETIQEEKQPIAQEEPEEIESTIEISQNTSSEVKIEPIKQQGAFSPNNEIDKKAKELFTQAKNQPQNNEGDSNAVNLLNEALGLLEQDENGNENIKAALHMERGKIFDNYDYVDYALRDYWEATKAKDLNLKANAFYKTGQIYDEFSEFTPALDNYISSVAYCGEADNKTAQSKVLSKIASLYTKQYDIERASDYSDLAEQSALDTSNNELIASIYSTNAQNYQYLGENKKAIDNYKNALSIFHKEESYEQMAYNYEQASIVMRKLGNNAKADSLLLKANQYYQKAQLAQTPQEVAS